MVRAPRLVCGTVPSGSRWMLARQTCPALTPAGVDRAWLSEADAASAARSSGSLAGPIDSGRSVRAPCCCTTWASSCPRRRWPEGVSGTNCPLANATRHRPCRGAGMDRMRRFLRQRIGVHAHAAEIVAEVRAHRFAQRRRQGGAGAFQGGINRRRNARGRRSCRRSGGALGSRRLLAHAAQAPERPAASPHAQVRCTSKAGAVGPARGRRAAMDALSEVVLAGGAARGVALMASLRFRPRSACDPVCRTRRAQPPAHVPFGSHGRPSSAARNAAFIAMLWMLPPATLSCARRSASRPIDRCVGGKHGTPYGTPFLHIGEGKLHRRSAAGA